jgi:hypothetical protein
VTPALLFPLIVVALAAVAALAGWIGYTAGLDHAEAAEQAEAADQAEAELTGRAAQLWAALGERGGPWPELGVWRVPDQLGIELPAGAPWIVGSPAHDGGLDVQDAEARPVTSPADLILSVLHQCDVTERYVQQLIDQNQETRGGAPDGG